MNANLISKVRMAVPFLAGRNSQELRLPVRRDWAGKKFKASKTINAGRAIFVAALLCLAGREKLQAVQANGADFEGKISSLTAKIAQLTADDTAAYTNFKALTASLNARLSATNETQAVLLVAGIVSGASGSQVTVPVTIIPGQFVPTAIQADFLLPPGVTFVSATAGPAATSAGKNIQTAVITGGVRLLVVGLNQTVMSQGVVATLSLTLGPNKTTYPIPMTNPVASDATGHEQPIAVTSGLIGAL